LVNRVKRQDPADSPGLDPIEKGIHGRIGLVPGLNDGDGPRSGQWLARARGILKEGKVGLDPMNWVAVKPFWPQGKGKWAFRCVE
jgi:hypothetical protein